jgi:hypothetical protein
VPVEVLLNNRLEFVQQVQVGQVLAHMACVLLGCRAVRVRRPDLSVPVGCSQYICVPQTQQVASAGVARRKDHESQPTVPANSHEVDAGTARGLGRSAVLFPQAMKGA